MTFIKKTENFVCKFCGIKVQGTGYTDHCPNCLHGKHVDFFPGDRKEPCKGLMEPLAITKKKGRWQIFYRCQKCGQKRFNKAAPDDNQEQIIKLSQKPVAYRQTMLVRRGGGRRSRIYLGKISYG